MTANIDTTVICLDKVRMLMRTSELRGFLCISIVVIASLAIYFAWPQSDAEKAYRRNSILKRCAHDSNHSELIPLYGRDRFLTCEPYVYMTKIADNTIVFFPEFRGHYTGIEGTILCEKPLDKHSTFIGSQGEKSIWLNLPKRGSTAYEKLGKFPVELLSNKSATEYDGNASSPSW